jgi:ATP-dependent DNA helicase RecG
MEKLGRGSVLIQQECKKAGLPAPKWKAEGSSGVSLTFFNPESTTEVPTEVTTEVPVEVTTEVKRVLVVLKGEMTRKELQQKLELKNDEHFRKAYLLPTLAAGCIAMTIPDKPNSSKQRYRLTPLGQTTRVTISK